MTQKTRVYLLRHGQVVGHETPSYNGHADVALTEYGLDQYHRLRERLADAGITACYSSDLSRCTIGAEIICAELGITPKLDARLRELNIGIWEGMTWTEIVAKYPHEWNARLADIVNYRVPEGESLLDLAGRAMPALAEIVSSHQGENVLVVGHGGMNRTLLLHAIGAQLSCLFNIEQKYGCLNIIDFYDDGKRTVALLNG
ncbi:MAG: alpha-ribazole phosphatase [Deltaproteobacteria bacterium HGW-Deltaproteobacteria-23]|jgi:alpha-ribazole phosphatase|nr:MAG: alpha-ribazole phosphatase [Deltaproteobacteria bacterium HGW-Deltaproteobacteria-23]